MRANLSNGYGKTEVPIYFENLLRIKNCTTCLQASLSLEFTKYFLFDGHLLGILHISSHLISTATLE